MAPPSRDGHVAHRLAVLEHCDIDHALRGVPHADVLHTRSTSVRDGIRQVQVLRRIYPLTRHALVYGAIEGSDEASLDGSSSLVRVRDGETEEFRVSPDSVGLSRETRAEISWKSTEDGTSRSLAALEGEARPVGDLILYNAALRLWTADEGTSLAGWVERAREALNSGAALRLLDRLRQPVPVGG